MSELVHDVLSIWEIAHRWHDHDPNITDPEKLPLEVQDKLRFLTRRMAYHDLPSCSRRGVQNWTDNAIISESEYMQNNEDDGEYDPDKYDYEAYYQNVSRRVDKHREITKNFDQCYERRIYDKEVLDNTFTLRYLLPKLCKRYEFDLPKFWFPDGIDHDNPENDKGAESTGQKLRPNQIDRQLCQAVASTLWAEFPQMNIVKIIGHKGIQTYCNGAQYTAATLREWVKHLDPRPEDKRRGRPKKQS